MEQLALRPRFLGSQRPFGALWLRVPGFVPAAFWFTALGLVVAGPLLGSGHLLLLDFPSGPQFPRLDTAGSAGLDNTLPLRAIQSALRHIDEGLSEKTVLVAPIVLGGLGMYRLARSALAVGWFPAAYAGTLFVLNPFVLDRYLAGHLYFLLAYAFVPWALGLLLRAHRTLSVKMAAAVGVTLATLAVASVHVAGVYALLVLGVAAVGPARRRKRFSFLGVASAVASALSAYWLVPAFASTTADPVRSADLTRFASRPAGFAVLPALAALYGFWRDEFVRPVTLHPELYGLLAPIVGLAAFGLLAYVRSPERRRATLLLGAAAVAGILLAGSTALPVLDSAATSVVSAVPPLGVYREPQKLLLVTIVAYALLGALGLEVIERRARRPLRLAASAVAVLSVILYGYAQLWGFGGRVQLSHYPTGWHRAGQVMAERGRGTLLVLPWHLYAVWSFSNGRIVANPALSFFPGTVLGADGESGRPATPVSRSVEQLVSNPRPGALDELLAHSHVRYVLVEREADWWRYAFVSRDRGLALLFHDRDVTLLENRAWSAA